MNGLQRNLRAVSSTSVLAWAFLSLAIGVWWAAKPYRAFEHDALYYMAEALSRSGLANFSRDLFFRYGSQGEFTPLMAPYASLVAWLGVHVSAWIVTVAGKLAWLVAGWCLARALARTSAQACLALSLVLVLPSFYPSADIFNYGESFATPRLVSEALALLGLAATVAGRRWWGGALVFMAFVAHPLMGAPACAGFLMMVHAAKAEVRPWRRAVVVLGLGMVLALAGAALGVHPLDRLFARYDQAWWDVVALRNDYALVQNWSVPSLMQLAAQCVFLGLAAAMSRAGSAARTLAQSLLIVALVGLAAWLFGCASRNVLLVQLQPWRVLWLTQWLTPILWVAAFPAAWRSWTPSDHTLAALVAAGLLVSPLGTVVLALVAGLLVWAPEQVARHVPAQRQRLLAFGILGTVLLMRLVSLPDLAAISRLTTTYQYPWVQALANEPAPWVTAGWALLHLGSRWSVPLRFAKAACGVSIGLALLSFGSWLAQGERLAHAEEPWAAELRQRLPADAVVYSTEPFPTLWLDLRRAQYADTIHGASALFNRDQALEVERRLRRLSVIGLSNWPANPRAEQGMVHLDADRIRALCREPEIDVVITVGRWNFASEHIQASHGQTLAVFECRQVRLVAQKEARHGGQ